MECCQWTQKSNKWTMPACTAAEVWKGQTMKRTSSGQPVYFLDCMTATTLLENAEFVVCNSRVRKGHKTFPSSFTYIILQYFFVHFSVWLDPTNSASKLDYFYFLLHFHACVIFSSAQHHLIVIFQQTLVVPVSTFRYHLAIGLCQNDIFRPCHKSLGRRTTSIKRLLLYICLSITLKRPCITFTTHYTHSN